MPTVGSGGGGFGAWRQLRRRRAVVAIAAVALAGAAVTPPSASAMPRTSAAPQTVISVSPAGPVRDGQAVRVSVTGAPPGTTLLAVECSSAALTIGEDGCENHRDAVFFADAAGDGSTSLVVTSHISTAASGQVSCQTTTCLLGVVRFTAPTTDTILGASALTFTPASCRGGADCEDAPPVPTTLARTRGGVPRVRGAVVLTPRRAYTTRLAATPAGDLRSDSAITGPFRPPTQSGTDAATRRDSLAAGTAHRERGEGIVQLSLEGPNTSWASHVDRAIVVSVRVDRDPWQQIVLFAGSTPFTYAGFTGPLATGEHRVSIRVDAGLSTTGSHLPVVVLYRERLRVVAPSNRMYLIQKYAPLVYGKATSAASDTQLLTYGTATKLKDGASALAYESIWTHEDAGTSFVPFLEWGEWGRMTDITATTSLTVSRSGVISDAMYHWCGCGPSFPPQRDSLQEVSVPFHGHYFDGTHMILRNASGNDYQSSVGKTAFRFQQPPVAGPGSGQPREAVMDAHPWTYRIMEDEVSAWYLDRSTDPFSGQPGEAPQYAIASLNATSTQDVTIAVDLRLSGSSTWYRSDMGSAAPLYTGGLGRTVVKLPANWQSRRVTGVQLAVYPGSAASTVRVRSFELLGLSSGYRVVRIARPTPTIVPGQVAPSSP